MAIPDWLHFSQLSGSGDAIITITASPNSGVGRWAEPHVSGPSKSLPVHIAQNPALEDGYVTLRMVSGGTLGIYKGDDSRSPLVSLEYSHNGRDWQTFNRSTEYTFNTGDVVMFRGENTTFANITHENNFFSGSCVFNLSGNIMSILYGDNYEEQYTIPAQYSCFSGLFRGTNVVSAEDLILPATSLRTYCYEGMFRDCAYLTKAPDLPATNLVGAEGCYRHMFEDCTSLTEAPELPATSIYYQVYQAMFRGCTNLTTAPDVLPAKNLLRACYEEMFKGTSITVAPELPAESLCMWCYAGMFENCSLLSNIRCYATYLYHEPDPRDSGVTLYESTENWVKGVAASGTFTKAAVTSNWPSGDNGIPSGWNVLNK